jgi:hypothetical protein
MKGANQKLKEYGRSRFKQHDASCMLALHLSLLYVEKYLGSEVHLSTYARSSNPTTVPRYEYRNIIPVILELEKRILSVFFFGTTTRNSEQSLSSSAHRFENCTSHRHLLMIKYLLVNERNYNFLNATSEVRFVSSLSNVLSAALFPPSESIPSYRRP